MERTSRGQTLSELRNEGQATASAESTTANIQPELVPPKRKPAIEYRLDPVMVAAHRDYEKWLKLNTADRDEHEIVGDPLCHFIRFHEAKQRWLAEDKPRKK